MSAHPSLRPPRVTLALLLLGAVAAGLTVAFAYGLSVDYGDTADPPWVTAARTIHLFGLGILAVAALAGGALATDTTSLRVRVGALGIVALAVVGTALAGLVGVDVRYGRYPATPSCSDGFTAGPALAVTRAADAAFRELRHPAPFADGGSAGVDGCSTLLVVRAGEDPVASYRRSLPRAGWRLGAETSHGLRAVKGRQGFTLGVDADGEWMVWIGPRELGGRAALAPKTSGRVGLRR